MKSHEPKISPRHKKDFNPLIPILRTWPKVLKEYVKRTKRFGESRPDLPFWYRERPQIGFLAIAAWKENFAVLEEWGLMKGPPKEQSQGRNDLWIGKSGKQWFFEAKHTFCNLYKSENAIRKQVERAYHKARESAKKVPTRSTVKVPAVFVSLIWKESEERTLEDGLNLLERVCDALKPAAFVVVSLKKEENYFYSKKNEHFIGGALLLFSAKGRNPKAAENQ